MTSQEKQIKFHRLLHTIRSHYTDGQHTYGQCGKRCGNAARGGGTCKFCAEKEMAELIDNEYVANKIHNLIAYQAEAVYTALDIIRGDK